MKDKYNGEDLYALIIDGMFYPIPETTARWMLNQSGWEPCTNIKRMHDGQIVPLNQHCGDIILLSTHHKYEYHNLTNSINTHKVTFTWTRPIKFTARQNTDLVYDPEELVV